MVLSKLLKLKDLPISTTVYVTQPNVGLADPITTDLTDDEEQQEHEQERNLIPKKVMTMLLKLKRIYHSFNSLKPNLISTKLLAKKLNN